MSDSDERVVTGTMLGLFLAFGADTIVIVAALWYVGALPAAAALGVSVAVLSAFLLWALLRWTRLRRVRGADTTTDAGANSGAEGDPVERLKRRYADGEVSDEEFERRIDRLLDADSRLDARARDVDDGRDRKGGRGREKDRETE